MEAKKTEQTWNPDRYERNAGFVADLGTPVFDLLAPVADEKILDLGCGHGKLTGKFADLGADVTGVDASPEQIAACHKLGLNARVLSGESLDYNGDFDAVFSNAALHWMQKADDVIAGVYRALKPGGRFVGEMGGGDNVKKVSDALLAALAQRRIDGNALWPWYFPTTDDYRGKLEKAGFRVDYMEMIDRPTPLPGDVSDWLDTFCESFLAAVPQSDRQDFLAQVRQALVPDLMDDNGQWTVDYVRLRFKAGKPE